MKLHSPLAIGTGLVVLAGLIAGDAALRAADPPPAPAPTTGPAESPIHWVAWSDDLFDRAKREHKFVLLDLEAVWCHWCHVEDGITYHDPDVAKLIADKYIAVKVDQDSRPDLANRYEDYGWPATIVLDADHHEIVKRSGYIPPRPMARMLEAIIKDPTPGPSAQPAKPIDYTRETALSPELRKSLEAKLDSNYDSKEGGWGTIHKFVDWDAVEYCDDVARTHRPDAKTRGDQARQTLTAGIALIDPAWGGVDQYSTDDDWTHPHYEKLLQFQAELLRAYSLGYAQWQDPAYRKAADNLRRYMDGFLRSPDGAFYVSQDADLHPGQHSDAYYALDDAGRRKLGVPRVDKHLYARENGWAIAGLVAQYSAFGDESALDEAKQSAHWVIDHRGLGDGGFRHDEVDKAGPYLADTLYMGRAFLALYAATADRDWLKRADAAAGFIRAHFTEPGDAPGFGTAATHGETAMPGATPWEPQPEFDENVSAARFFNLLAHYTGKADYHKAADNAMRFLATPAIAKSRSLWISGILLANDELASDPIHVTIVGPKDDPAAKALFAAALASPVTYKRLEWFDRKEGPLPNSDVEYPQLKHSAAFLCTGNACSSPMTKPEALSHKLWPGEKEGGK